VHHLHLDADLARAEDDVRVRGGAQRVADHEERHVGVLGAAVHAFGQIVALERLAVRHRDGLPDGLLEGRVVDAKDGRVPLQEDRLAPLGGLEAAHRHVVGVVQPEADDVEHHGARGWRRAVGGGL
jgi:hypothetical protein